MSKRVALRKLFAACIRRRCADSTARQIDDYRVLNAKATFLQKLFRHSRKAQNMRQILSLGGDHFFDARCGLALQCWKDRWEWKREHHAREALGAKHWRRERLQQGIDMLKVTLAGRKLRHWERTVFMTVLFHRLRRKAIVARVIRMMQIYLLRRGWRGLRQNASYCILKSVGLRIRQAKALWGLSTFAKTSTRDRRNKESVEILLTVRRSVLSFRRWRREVWRQRTARSFSKRNDSSRAIDMLRRNADRRKRRARKIQVAVAHSINRGYGTGLRALRRLGIMRRILRRDLRDAVAHYTEYRYGQCFATIRANALCRAALRLRLTSTLRHMRKSAVRIRRAKLLLGRWHRWAALRRHIPRYAKGKAVRRVLRRWKFVAYRQKKRQQDIALLEQHCTLRMKIVAVKALYQGMVQRRERSLVEKGADKHFRQRAARKMLEELRTIARMGHMRRAEEAVASDVENRAYRNAFSLWRTRYLRRKRLFDTVQRCRQLCRVRTKERIFRSWTKAFSAKTVLRSMLEYSSRLRMRSSFDKWTSMTRLGREQEAHLELVCRRKLLDNTMRHWRELWSSRTFLRLVLHTWSNWTAEFRAKRYTGGEVFLVRWRHFFINKTLKKWRKTVSDIATVERMEKALHFAVAGRSMRLAFERLVLMQEHTAETACQLFAIARRRQQARCFHQWKTIGLLRQRESRKVAIADAHRRRGSCGAAFMRLATMLFRGKRAKKASCVNQMVYCIRISYSTTMKMNVVTTCECGFKDQSNHAPKKKRTAQSAEALMSDV